VTALARVVRRSGAALRLLLLLLGGCAAAVPADPLRLEVPPASPAVIHARVVQRARALGYTVEVVDLARGPVRIEAMTDDVALVDGRPLSRTRSAFLVRAHADGTVWMHAVGDGVDLRRRRMSRALRRELEELAALLGASLATPAVSADGAAAVEPRRAREGP